MNGLMGKDKSISSVYVSTPHTCSFDFADTVSLTAEVGNILGVETLMNLTPIYQYRH